MSMTRQQLPIIAEHLGLGEIPDPSDLPVAWMVDGTHMLELHLQDGRFLLMARLAENLAEGAPELDAALEICSSRLHPDHGVPAFRPEDNTLLLWIPLMDSSDPNEVKRQITRFLLELTQWYERLPEPSAS